MGRKVIKINEDNIRQIVAEALKESLSEGKFARALGTAALGGALMFGGHNSNAQAPQRDTTVQQNVMPKDTLDKSPQKDTLSLQTSSDEQKPYIFVANKFKTDYTHIMSLKRQYDTRQKVWAEELAKKFPVDKNGAIHLEYIIVCNQEIDIQKAMEVSVQWFNYAFSSSEAIKQCDYEKGVIIGHGTYTNIAQYNLNAIYYAKTVRVNADTDVILRFKENRIKIEVIIRHYNIISGDSMLQSKNSLVQVSDAFPFADSGDKVAFARAFINSYAHSFDKVEKYIKFMNENMTDPFDTSDDDW